MIMKGSGGVDPEFSLFLFFFVRVFFLLLLHPLHKVSVLGGSFIQGDFSDTHSNGFPNKVYLNSLKRHHNLKLQNFLSSLPFYFFIFE